MYEDRIADKNILHHIMIEKHSILNIILLFQ